MLKENRPNIVVDDNYRMFVKEMQRRYAERGAMAGLLIGIFLTPVGMILGSFLGAFLAELYWGKKKATDALKAAGGSFLGFITGTGLKTIVACLILWKIFVFAF